jgi:hypothetical protein
MRSHTSPTVGSLLRRVVLATESLYRVVALDGSLVAVEVVEAPGLAAGFRLKLTREAARSMHLVREDAAALAAAAPMRPLAA